VFGQTLALMTRAGASPTVWGGPGFFYIEGTESDFFEKIFEK
jgi:hypothetical protein